MSYIFFLLLFGVTVSCHSSNYSYRFYPTYHLGPLINLTSKNSWMNDPCGFSIFNGEYHLFYQYNPEFSSGPGIARWGHAKSTDLFHWENLPIALSPDKSYDIDGVFTGSAIIENNTMYIYYTGNVNRFGQTPRRNETQNFVTSSDARIFVKYDKNPIILGADLQPRFRDPFVWKHSDEYYMVLGNSFDGETRGRVLLYKSSDKVNWQRTSVIDQSNGSLGYMWECPNFFELDGYFVLLISPQGIKPQGDKYNNIYSNGYIVGTFDYSTNIFTEVYTYKELDHGHDFYAAQTTIDMHGDRVIVAWNDMYEQDYPEVADGFTGQMTIPRRLMLKDGNLLQQPVNEIYRAVGKNLYNGVGLGGTTVTFTNHTGRIEVSAPPMKDFTLYIENKGGNQSVKISYSQEQGRVALDRGGKDGVRRTEYRPMLAETLYLLVYIDKSSIEAFFGRMGEVTFSSRFFPDEQPLTTRIADDSVAFVFMVNDMIRTVPLPLTPPK